MATNTVFGLKMLRGVLSIVFNNEISPPVGYYLAPTGNDTTGAGTIASPWYSINKAIAVVSPGENIIMRGGTYNYGGVQTINKNGTLGNPITIMNYPSESPIVTGFTTITGWTSLDGSIYYKDVSVQSTPTILLIDGVNTEMGKFPNTGYYTIDSATADTSISDASLNSAVVNWTGADVVIRKNMYLLDKCKVTSHIGTTLVYTDASTSFVGASAGWGYFLQNHIKTLQSYGDWCCSTNRLYVYFGATDPATKTVQIPSIDKILYASSRSYVNIDGITASGANIYPIQIVSSSSVNISDCAIRNSGLDGIYFDSQYGVISNCVVENTNQIGIHIESNNTTVIDNSIHNCGVFLGSSLRGDLALGIYAKGADNYYQYNQISSTGYHGIYLVVAPRSTVKNNKVDSFCLNLNDGGGIYTAGGTASYPTGVTNRVIDGNIVLNGIGSLSGAVGSIMIVEGIYIDEPTFDIVIQNNTCAFNPYSGIKLHNTHDISVLNNTFFGNLVTGIRLQESNATTPLRNLNFFDNVVVAKSGALAIKHITVTNDVSIMGKFDRNIYARPVLDTTIIETGSPSEGTVSRTLSSWKTYSQQDSSSLGSFASVTSDSSLRFEYNDTKVSKEISLGSKSYYTMDGSLVAGSITLEPYRSVCLIQH